MSQRYTRYQRAAPGSFKALQSEAWLEHSARFRPKLVELQDSLRTQLDKRKGKKKALSAKLLKSFTKEMTDYIVFSGSSFLQYLCRYEAAYLCELLEKRDIEVSGKIFPMFEKILLSEVKTRTEKVRAKSKKKLKTKRKIKK